MIHIQQLDRYNQIRECLAHALGNTTEIISILKEVTLSDNIDLLFYDPTEQLFYDKVKKNTISIQFLEQNNSMIGKAYVSQSPYSSSHILYDQHYNISIDNPFRLSLSAQVIIPIINEEKVVGMIRFSKSKYTFDKDILKSLHILEGSFSDIFSVEMDKIAEKLNSTFFSIKKDAVYEIIDDFKKKTNLLCMNTDNPEIKKLIHNIKDHIESISDYIHFDANHIPIQQKEKESENTSCMRVLIADDVQMNVKILNAMIKDNPLLDISFAYDGIETLKKIRQGYKDKHSIDILFLDHYMPGKLGLAITQAIRKYESMNNLKSHLIIISITNDPSAIEAKKDLYDYHISKPFARTDISTVMESIKDSLEMD